MKYQKVILATVVGFLIHYLIYRLYFREIFFFIRGDSNLSWPAFTLAYLIVGIPLFSAATCLFRPKAIPASLGFDRSPLLALSVSFLATAPMLLGYAASYPLSESISPDALAIGCLDAAFFEETYYRAFLFGYLFRYTRLGFLPAILASALLFAVGHLYQSQDPAKLIGIFLTTFFGGIYFAWAYVEWNYNLWVPIGLHFFMNLHWELFQVDDTALGDNNANLFRLGSILLFIAITVIVKRRHQRPLTISRNTIWMKRSPLPDESSPTNN